MFIVLSARHAERLTGGVLACAAALALAGCLVADGSGVADLRGVSRGGWKATAGERRDPTLTAAGARVRVLVSPVGCRFRGFVTGKGARDPDQSAQAVAPRVLEGEAVQDARNLAGAAGADAVVIDARERWRFPRSASTVEALRISVVLVHGRAYRCDASTGPRPAAR